MSHDEWILKSLFYWFHIRLIYTLYSIFSYLCIFSTSETAWSSQLMVEMSLTVVTETNQFWNEALWDYMCRVIFRLIISHSDIALISDNLDCFLLKLHFSRTMSQRVVGNAYRSIFRNVSQSVREYVNVRSRESLIPMKLITDI